MSAGNTLWLHTRFPCTVATPYISAIPNPGPGSRAEWSRGYHVLTISRRGLRPAGFLELRRRLADSGTVRAAVDYRRDLPGGARHQITARMLCRDDPLGTALSWTLSCVSKDSDGRELPATRYVQKGTVLKDEVFLRAYGHTRVIQLSGERPVLNWSLFTSIAHMPPASSDASRFTWLDDMDQPKPGCQLLQVASLTASAGAKRAVRERPVELERGRLYRPEWVWQDGRQYRLVEYHLVGPGTVPWVFYTDETQRLLFAGAGTEAYCLARDGSAAADEETDTP